MALVRRGMAALVLLGAVLAGTGQGQTFPKATPEGAKAANERAQLLPMPAAERRARETRQPGRRSS